MVKVKRFPHNPILSPNQKNSWEAQAVFNGSPIKTGNKYYLCYRAVSLEKKSTIGLAVSDDGFQFKERRQFLKPEFPWEKFGCEDPRVTQFENQYFIFYTALSTYPFTPSGIKIGLAVTSDFQKIIKYPVTNFNSKAMALFPERINGQIAAILTANTDLPPAKIGLAFFKEAEEISNQDYWREWYARSDEFRLDLSRSPNDHVEVGAPPLKTQDGWLLIYCYIYNYFAPPPIFSIEAVLLDLNDPFRILGRSKRPLLTPQKDYEVEGSIPNIVFPSGALIEKDELRIYYGGADTVCCGASCSLAELLAEIKTPQKSFLVKLERFEKNPILRAVKEYPWEAKAAFNPTAIYLNNQVHLLFRAMSQDNVSSIGYAVSDNGLNFKERLNEPIYKPREAFEMKARPGNSGCEDARLTLLGDRLYLCYTAFDGVNPPRVALSSITCQNFLQKKWQWQKAKLISPPGVSDKNAGLLPEKINHQYVFFHRLENCIWVDFVNDLDFGDERWIRGEIILRPKVIGWDTEKVGIAAPPLKTQDGWLLIYHGISKDDKRYRLGAALLDLEDPKIVLSRLDYPLIEPEKNYEIDSGGRGIIFACGAVIIKDKLLVYYGGADEVVCGASLKLNDLLQALD